MTMRDIDIALKKINSRRYNEKADEIDIIRFAMRSDKTIPRMQSAMKAKSDRVEFTDQEDEIAERAAAQALERVKMERFQKRG